MKTQQPNKSQNKSAQFNIINQAEFDFLQELPHVKQVNQQSLKLQNMFKVLSNSQYITNIWFKLYRPQYLLYQFNEQNKTIRIFEKHQKYRTITSPDWLKYSCIIRFDKWRHFTESSQFKLLKNFRNGSYFIEFTHSKSKYTQTQTDLKLVQTHALSANLKFNKWLTQTIYQNSKTISYSLKRFLTLKYFKQANLKLFISNKQNFRNQVQKTNLGQSPVLKSLDILGFQTNLFSNNGLKLKLDSGYNFFNKGYYNKLAFRHKKRLDWKDITLQFKTRGGMLFGKNIQINNLLNRNKTKFMSDGSTKFLNPRINIWINKFYNQIQICPFIYLEGWMSRNLTELNNKYQFDYGVGLKIFHIYIDWSLIRFARSIDQMGGPSIKFNF